MYELSFQTPWHRPYRDGIHDSGGGGQGIFVDFAFHSPPPVCFGALVCHGWQPGGQGPPNHSIPPANQRDVQAASRVTQGRSLGFSYRFALRGLGRPLGFSSWTGPWPAAPGSWGIHACEPPPPSCFNTSMLSLRSTRDSFSIPGAPLPARPYCSVWRPVQGYSTRPKAFPFWTLEVGRRLFLLIDLSLHMSCMIKWCRPRPSSAAVRLPPGWQTLVFPVGVPPTRHSLSCLQLFLTTSASLVHRHP